MNAPIGAHAAEREVGFGPGHEDELRARRHGVGQRLHQRPHRTAPEPVRVIDDEDERSRPFGDRALEPGHQHTAEVDGDRGELPLRTGFERLELVEHADDVREQDCRVVMLSGRIEPGDGPVIVGQPLRHERRLTEAGATEHEDHRHIGRGAQLIEEPRAMDQPGSRGDPQPLRRFQSRHYVPRPDPHDSPEIPFFHNFFRIAQERHSSRKRSKPSKHRAIGRT